MNANRVHGKGPTLKWGAASVHSVPPGSIRRLVCLTSRHVRYTPNPTYVEQTREITDAMVLSITARHAPRAISTTSQARAAATVRQAGLSVLGTA
jgi:hypothetical protein